jgi:hypothetical protein
MVVLEIFQDGAVPFAELPTAAVVRSVMSGAVPPRTETVPTRIYSMLLHCWHADPHHRPTFQSLAERLGSAGDAKQQHGDHRHRRQRQLSVISASSFTAFREESSRLDPFYLNNLDAPPARHGSPGPPRAASGEIDPHYVGDEGNGGDRGSRGSVPHFGHQHSFALGSPPRASFLHGGSFSEDTGIAAAPAAPRATYPYEYLHLMGDVGIAAADRVARQASWGSAGVGGSSDIQGAAGAGTPGAGDSDKPRRCSSDASSIMQMSEV